MSLPEGLLEVFQKQKIVGGFFKISSKGLPLKIPLYMAYQYPYEIPLSMFTKQNQETLFRLSNNNLMCMSVCQFDSNNRTEKK